MGLIDFVKKEFFDREERMKRQRKEIERMRTELDFIQAKKEYVAEKEQLRELERRQNPLWKLFYGKEENRK